MATPILRLGSAHIDVIDSILEEAERNPSYSTHYIITTEPQIILIFFRGHTLTHIIPYRVDEDDMVTYYTVEEEY